MGLGERDRYDGYLPILGLVATLKREVDGVGVSVGGVEGRVDVGEGDEVATLGSDTFGGFKDC